ncbi:MAG: hypothetical protein RL095_240 [Verrucomicrobiota bacterium]|jgi:DNA-binding CsgD family transcriptional regulator
MPKPEWQPSPEQLAALGTETDKTLGELWGVPHYTIYNYRKRHGIAARPRDEAWKLPPEFEHLLGNTSDKQIARLAGVSKNLIKEHRYRHNIAAKPKWQPSAESIAQMGVLSDVEIAQREGVLPASVTQYRRRRGIAGRSFSVPDALLPLLGTMSDEDFARSHGLNSPTVRKTRKELGIPVFGAPLQPSPEQEKWLGQELDSVLSEWWKIPAQTIRRWRIQRGLSSPRRSFWTEDRVALLGTMSDNEVARQLGIHAGSVSTQRRRHGIAPYEENFFDDSFCWTRKWLDKLGTMTDKALAKEIGCRPNTVSTERVARGIPAFLTKHWTAENLALLGTMTDSELARRMGLSSGAVMGMRHKHQIPLFKHKPMSRLGKGFNWQAEHIALFGTMSDSALARQLGICGATVHKKRRSLGIPLFDGSKKSDS